MKLHVAFCIIVLTTLCALTTAISAECGDARHNVVCYYDVTMHRLRAVMADGNGHLGLCSHIVYSQSSLALTGTVKRPSAWDIHAYRQMRDLKTTNPCLKTLVSVRDDQRHRVADIVNIPYLRHKLALGAVQFLQRYHFDGVEFDEDELMGTVTNSTAVSLNAFADFAEEMRLIYAGRTNGKLILASAIDPSLLQDDGSAAAAMLRHVDFASVKPEYGQHQPRTSLTPSTWSEHAANEADHLDTLLSRLRTVYAKDTSKLMISAAGGQHGHGRQVCVRTHHASLRAKVLGAHREESRQQRLKRAASRAHYIKQKALGGVVVWNMAKQADACGAEGDGPLLKTVSAVMRCHADVTCERDGKVEDPNDCRRFYMCSNTGSENEAITLFVCPRGMIYSSARKSCVHRARALNIRRLCMCGELAE
ncbi:PREDICTED: uncharacterized protein LOC106814494 [Priapulus caudatus]|uniref:Uncharacterized protein LOC106814494 n=1 Tax=Priapulus caudatus TaxID=37621 RepID=A0ABM1EQ24_PRICU|nr:PREDICTED: uncharacterized protein LOC106814494 [Priapulus caudatus]